MIDIAQEYESIRTEYVQVVEGFRALADVRFKLLAFLPIGTAVSILFIDTRSSEFQPLLSAFGLVVTLALMIYNTRNDQLYDELASRAAELERKLQLFGGHFNQRPGSWLVIRPLDLFHLSWPLEINHGTAIGTIYKASLTAWLFGMIYPFFSWVFHTFTIDNSPLGAPNQSLIAGFSVIVAVVIIWVFSSSFKKQINARKNEMRNAACIAIEVLSKLEFTLPNNDKISDWNKAFYALAIAKYGELKDKELEEKMKEIRQRAKYYLLKAHLESDSLFFPKPNAGNKLGVNSAVHLAAVLSDLPARWLLDTYTGRRVERTCVDLPNANPCLQQTEEQTKQWIQQLNLGGYSAPKMEEDVLVKNMLKRDMTTNVRIYRIMLVKIRLILLFVVIFGLHKFQHVVDYYKRWRKKGEAEQHY